MAKKMRGARDNFFIIPELTPMGDLKEENPPHYVAAPYRDMESRDSVATGPHPHQVDAQIIAAATHSEKIKKWALDLAAREHGLLKSRDKDFLRQNIDWSWKKIAPNVKYMELSLSERQILCENYIAHR